MFGSKPRFMDTDPLLTRTKIDNLLPIDPSLETIVFVHPVRVRFCGSGVGFDLTTPLFSLSLSDNRCHFAVPESATVEHASQPI